MEKKSFNLFYFVILISGVYIQMYVFHKIHLQLGKTGSKL